jgi:serine/threonine-protein kinase
MSSVPGDGGKQLIGGRYEIDELLGRGGMAEVRKGCDRRLGRTVAVKRLRPDLASDPTFYARFRREAQSAASLNHPSIVAVYDTGEEPAPDGSGLSLPYIVMEYVDGRTLREVMREGRKILPERALEITAAVLEALDYSHRAGIIHRDIKPANVMLTPSGHVKVMDFGIARAVSDTSSTMTQTAAVLGTAQYLSPEQARGEQVDARSDIYSTGCVLFELLTGRPPFVGDSPVSVAYQHVREAASAPSTLDPQISPDIDAITAKALAKSTDTRYQSAAEMRADIERALAGHQVSAPAVAAAEATQQFLPSAPPTQALAATTMAPAAATEEADPKRRRGWAYVLLGLVVLALFVAAAVYGRELFGPDTTAATEVSVPNVQGMKVDRATAKLEKEGLRTRVEFEKSDTIDKGLVISTDPPDGEFVDEGTRVLLLVSGGKRLVAVPPLKGGTLAEARAALDAVQLEIEPVPRESTEEKNQVLSTDPPADTRMPVGRTVTVYYSEGLVDMPKVVGMSRVDAQRLLRRLGFDPAVTFDPTSTRPAGTVIAQDPLPGQPEPVGARVIITVSDPPPTPPPSSATSPSESPTETETSPSDTPTDTGTEPSDTSTAPGGGQTSPGEEDSTTPGDGG